MMLRTRCVKLQGAGFIGLSMAVLASAGGIEPGMAGEPAVEGAHDETTVRRSHLVCRGNEPFWHVNAYLGQGHGTTQATGIATRLMAQGITANRFEGNLTRIGHLDPPWQVFRGVDPQDQTRVLHLTARAETCYDTMSDEPAFSWRAVVSFADGTLADGCCRIEDALDPERAPRAVMAEKRSDDWSHLLPDLHPAIASCVASQQARGGEVTAVAKAWPMNRGFIGVRLHDAYGERSDCVIDPVTGGSERHRPVSASDLLPGEDAPRFFPTSLDEPFLRCGRLERAHGRDGRLIGYLHYGSGC
jgi:uncharacterized membrane protein